MINENIIPVWKNPGLTSFDVVQKIKSYDKNVKVGHCGTLDPFAEGILIVCKGDAINKIDSFMSLPKEYIATFTLGCETDTLDKTGQIIKKDNNYLNLNMKKIKSVLNDFIGEQYQTPPYFSALKFKGKSLYKYARKGIFIRKRPRLILVDDISFIDFKLNKLKVYIKCSKGTYIRSLSKDISYALNTCAHVSELTRTAIGPYNKNNSYKLESLAC